MIDRGKLVGGTLLETLSKKRHDGSVDLLSHFTKVKCDSWT